MPGIGPRTASELVISIDISDFPSHDRLASYCGLAPRNRWGDYHARCRGRGTPRGKAPKAVARKRLKVIYAVMRDGVPYVS